MPSPATKHLPPPARTKIERAVESIESLCNTICTLRDKPDDDRTAAMKDVLEAREECSAALAEFLTPVLRVVS